MEFRHHTSAHPVPLARSGTDAGAYLAQRRGDAEFLLQGKVRDIAHATIYSAGESFMLLTVAGSSPGCARRPHRLRALGPCLWEQRAVLPVVTPGGEAGGVNVIVIACPLATAAPACEQLDVAVP